MKNLTEYHKKNVKLIIALLVVWAIVSYGGALLARPLNSITFIGFPLGYWVSAQLSVVTFVILIFVYASKMNKLDVEFGVEE